MMLLRHKIGPIFLFSIGAIQTVFGAGSSPSDWKSECIGHYQVAVPGAVEIALSKRSNFFNMDNMGANIFEDGSNAPYSGFTSTNRRWTEIGAFTSVEDFEKLRAQISAEKKADKKKLLQTGKKIISDSIGPYKLNIPDTFAWKDSVGIDVYFFRDNRIYQYMAMDFKTLAENEADLNHFLSNFRTRQLFEIPDENGICFPYSFLKSNSFNRLIVGVTMRLKDHPDVEIFFKETMATPPPPPSKDDINFDADKTVRNFLEAHLETTEGIYQINYSFPKTRSIKLDGREGKASFVEIIRDDDHSHDFAYVAAVKGDPKSVTDAPDLMLYVVRNAARAKGEPVSKSELKEIAEKITDSIKRRH